MNYIIFTIVFLYKKIMKTIFIALDGQHSLDDFYYIAKELSLVYSKKQQQELGIEVCFKIGLEFFLNYGFYGVNKIEDLESDIFLDLKFFDITNTVLGALKSIYKSSNGFVKYTTIHLLNGTECLGVVKDFNLQNKNKIQILGVSFLTSLDDKYLKEQNFNYLNVQEGVCELLKLSSNLVDGCICSPLEAGVIRNLCSNNFTIVTPGVQLHKLENDQKRVSTPLDAFRSGANGIVIGRSIMLQKDKSLALQNVVNSII
jgi:orotidine-5'-phosphate decarboxylase